METTTDVPTVPRTTTGFVLNEAAEATQRRLRYELEGHGHGVASVPFLRAAALALRKPLLDALRLTEDRQRGRRTTCCVSTDLRADDAFASSLQSLGLMSIFQGALAGRRPNPPAADELGDVEAGREAADFLDAMSGLDLPAWGYGLGDVHALYGPAVGAAARHARSDDWAALGSLWAVERDDEACAVPCYGRVVGGGRDAEAPWREWRTIVGVPRDVPIVGHGGRTVNRLRLFSARPHQGAGRFDEGVVAAGERRLLEEYFLVACAVRDLVRRFAREHGDFRKLPHTVALQCDDTQPVLVALELMRVLVDEQHLPWTEAWAATCGTCGCTNDVLITEAFARWPVSLLARVLPRHLQILCELNHSFLEAGPHVAWPPAAAERPALEMHPLRA